MPRGANTCTTCHADAKKLDLRGTIAGTGRVTSYEELLLGDPLVDANGQPVTRLRGRRADGRARAAPLVETSSGAANTAGVARKSRLTEIMFGETLLAGGDARTAHPNPPPVRRTTRTMLNAAEKRLLVEWMDLGGQYYNNPFGDGSAVRMITGLSQAGLRVAGAADPESTCGASCHQPVGSDRAHAVGRLVPREPLRAHR